MLLLFRVVCPPPCVGEFEYYVVRPGSVPVERAPTSFPYAPIQVEKVEEAARAETSADMRHGGSAPPRAWTHPGVSPVLDQYRAVHSRMDGALVSVRPGRRWHRDLKRTGSLVSEGAETVETSNVTLCPSGLPPAHVHVTVALGETWILAGLKKSFETVTSIVATGSVSFSPFVPESEPHPATVRKRYITIQWAPRLT